MDARYFSNWVEVARLFGSEAWKGFLRAHNEGADLEFSCASGNFARERENWLNRQAGLPQLAAGVFNFLVAAYDGQEKKVVEYFSGSGTRYLFYQSWSGIGAVRFATEKSRASDIWWFGEEPGNKGPVPKAIETILSTERKSIVKHRLADH